MDRDRRRVRRWRRRLARGVGKSKTRAAGRRNSHGSRAAGPSCAAGALGSELPVRAVDSVASVEEGVGGACIGTGGVVATILVC